MRTATTWSRPVSESTVRHKFRLLRHFLHNSGRVPPRSRLLEDVWSDDFRGAQRSSRPTSPIRGAESTPPDRECSTAAAALGKHCAALYRGTNRPKDWTLAAMPGYSRIATRVAERRRHQRSETLDLASERPKGSSDPRRCTP